MRQGILLLLVPLMILAGCDGGGEGPSTTSSTTSSTTTTTVAQVLELTVTSRRECADFFCDTSFYNLTFRNTGTVGLNIDFLRGFNASGNPIFEIGSDKFIRAFGSNRVGPGEELVGVLNAQTAFSLLIQYTGDNGVTKEVTLLT